MSSNVKTIKMNSTLEEKTLTSRTIGINKVAESTTGLWYLKGACQLAQLRARALGAMPNSVPPPPFYGARRQQ